MKKHLFLLLSIAIVLTVTSCNEKNEPSAEGNNSGTEQGGTSGGSSVQVPTGAISGQFSVSSGKKVFFSFGNLQYQASTNLWRFALHQYDTVGVDNRHIADDYSGWIDLFGWGTGSNPTSTSTNEYDYATFTNWGINTISNGNDNASNWRTLSKDEWAYLFYSRTNAAILFGLGKVCGVNGVIILPDNWTGTKFTDTQNGLADQGSYYYNSNGTNYTFHSYDSNAWDAMENEGAVFLPAAGYRFGMDDIRDVGSCGYYWSETSQRTAYSYLLFFNEYNLNPMKDVPRYYGRSVRLVQDVK